MTPEGSRFLWRAEAVALNGPSASRRMVDNLAKDLCRKCKRGTLHDRAVCAASKFWLARSGGFDFFTADFVSGYLQVFTPNTLAAILVAANEEYWVKNVEKMTLTDPLYDSVSARLTEICPGHPQLQFVGDYGAESGYHHE